MRRTRNGQRETDGKARAVAIRCPRCRAQPGAKCWSVITTGTVDYVHQERLDAADKARKEAQ